MERCARCDVSKNEIRLFDAVYEGKMALLCERCSIIENIPIIKKPNTEQLKNSEEITRVDKRMKKISGIKDLKKEETFFKKDELIRLEENPQMELPEENKLNLIPNYHWEIMKNRRRKGVTQKQLAESLGESEIAVQMIEKNKLPENAEILIKKLEQFFQIKLRKFTETERFFQKKTNKPVLLDEYGRELNIIPEPEPVIIEPLEIEPDNHFQELNSLEQSRELERIKKFQSKEPRKSEDLFTPKYYPIIKHKNSNSDLIDLDERKIIEPSKNSGLLTKKETSQSSYQQSRTHEKIPDFNIRKANLNNITINQLRDIHRKKIEVTRQEQLEEQRKIEERQRILEAKREKDRIRQELKQFQQKNERRKIEEQKQKLVNEKKQELQQIRKKESEEIDQYLGGSELLNKNSDYSKRLEDRKDIEEFDEELM